MATVTGRCRRRTTTMPARPASSAACCPDSGSEGTTAPGPEQRMSKPLTSAYGVRLAKVASRPSDRRFRQIVPPSRGASPTARADQASRSPKVPEPNSRRAVKSGPAKAASGRAPADERPPACQPAAAGGRAGPADPLPGRAPASPGATARPKKTGPRGPGRGSRHRPRDAQRDATGVVPSAGAAGPVQPPPSTRYSVTWFCRRSRFACTDSCCDWNSERCASSRSSWLAAPLR